MPKSDGTAGNAVGGLDGLLRGLGGILKVATDLVGKTDAPVEVSRGTSVGTPDTASASYGVSVRVGPARRPSFRRTASISRKPQSSARDDFREPNTDVFDEADHYIVVAELPGATECSVHWQVQGNVLAIKANSDDRHYVKDIVLESAVKDDNVSFALVNGIAEFRLWKR